MNKLKFATVFGQTPNLEDMEFVKFQKMKLFFQYFFRIEIDFKCFLTIVQVEKVSKFFCLDHICKNLRIRVEIKCPIHSCNFFEFSFNVKAIVIGLFIYFPQNSFHKNFYVA